MESLRSDLKNFHTSSRPENASFEVALEEGFFYDNDSCFHGNPFRQTPEYEAYEQFSLVIGLLTLGRSPPLIHIMYYIFIGCVPIFIQNLC